MKKPFKGFWIFYILWVIVNITVMIMAFNDTFGEFDKTTEEFWPITVGNPRYYDFIELLVYLGIPLFIFYLTRIIHPHPVTEDKESE
jgi:hypothetical protein